MAPVSRTNVFYCRKCRDFATDNIETFNENDEMCIPCCEATERNILLILSTSRMRPRFNANSARYRQMGER